MEWFLGLGGIVVLFAVFLLIAIRHKRSKADQLVSIVMLRDSPRRLTEADVRGAVRRAWQGLSDEPEVMMGPSPDPPTSNGFIVLLSGAPVFIVIDAGRPYDDDPKDSADRFEDLRVRKAYAGHGAWVSVDVIGGMPGDEVRDLVLAMLGRIAAELLDDGCVLLYVPALDRLALPGAETEDLLRSGDPLQIFNDPAVNMPITSVEANDRRINRAIEEARRNWPRFVEIWERSGPASSAMVKGRFMHDDGNEYMWLEVSRMDAVNITGVLVNEPVHAKNVKKGESVRVPVEDVVDWACIDGEEPVGLFVEKLLRGE